jgi:peptidoglycan/xylan/chitin deacetylase (PgdA/CDA1 family)
MSVFVFMYHRTPMEPDDRFDVSLSSFKAQIDALIAAGVSIIPFAEVNSRALPRLGKYAAITFDDGHASNAAAFDYLAERGVPSSAFIVRRWSETGVGEHGAGYLKAAELRAIAPLCELGGHGMTHRPLAKIPLVEAEEELRSSRAYLEDVLGRSVETMALPGGSISDAVIDRAQAVGFKLIGNSIFSPHTRESASVRRIEVRAKDGADYLVRTIRTPGALWAAREAERAFRRRRRNAVAKIRGSVSACRNLLRPVAAGA